MKKMSKVDQLIEQYGTLEEFKKSAWKACHEMMITSNEAINGIKNYEAELLKAIKEDQDMESRKVIDIKELRKIRDSKKKMK